MPVLSLTVCFIVFAMWVCRSEIHAVWSEGGTFVC